MDYRDKIIEVVAGAALVRLERRIIRQLQQLRNGLLSGDDSGIASTWDELCVQMQSEQSFYWDAYEETGLAVIRPSVRSLPHYERTAIWLQTDCGFDWSFDAAEGDEVPYVEAEIVEFVWSHVLSRATSWSNPRISRYLAQEYEHD